MVCMPQINIYAPDGSFVGSAAGNASDGRNDVFTFTADPVGQLPRPGDRGRHDQRRRVHPERPGGRHDRPAVHGHVDQPGQRRLSSATRSRRWTCSSASTVLVSSLSTSDFMIDGSPATGFTVNGANDVTFYFATTTNGVHNVSISGVVDLQT